MRCFGILIMVTALFGAASSAAQDQRTQEYLKQEEHRKKSELLRQLDSGVYFLDIGEHALADAKFRLVLQNIKSVPSDLTFYFGKNSFHLGNYRQSVDWLNKYIQLKGTTGQFYEEAISYLGKAERELVMVKAEEGKKAEEVFSKNYDLDCGPAGKVSCPVCKGDHVIIKRGPLGDDYRTCPYCNEHGILTCEEYNRLLRGELQKKQ